MDSNSAWRPWCEGNGRAFHDPKILPEVRLMAEAYLERHPMHPHTLETMATVEDEEHLENFLEKYTTPFDCSARALLFERYRQHGDAERFEPERRFQLYYTFDHLLDSRYLVKWGEGKDAAEEFSETLLSLIRSNAVDDGPDMWVEYRFNQGFESAKRYVVRGELDDAVAQIEAIVRLLEETMKIKDEVLLPTSCRFLDGMEWRAKEAWNPRDNGPDSPEERMIQIITLMSGMIHGYCVYPSRYYDMLCENAFDPLRGDPDFEALCGRVKALIITRSKEK